MYNFIHKLVRLRFGDRWSRGRLWSWLRCGRVAGFGMGSDVLVQNIDASRLAEGLNIFAVTVQVHLRVPIDAILATEILPEASDRGSMVTRAYKRTSMNRAVYLSKMDAGVSLLLVLLKKLGPCG